MSQRAVALIVDDDEEMRSLFEMHLQALGYETHVVRNAGLAKAWLQSNAPELVMLDVMMPDGNGLDLCRWIRSQPRLERVPVIVSSALEDEETEQDALELGAVDFLRKPFELETLKEKIERLRRP